MKFFLSQIGTQRIKQNRPPCMVDIRHAHQSIFYSQQLALTEASGSWNFILYMSDDSVFVGFHNYSIICSTDDLLV